MNTGFDVIKNLLRTEKGVLLEKGHQYVFSVAPDATKIDIRRAVEEVYKVKVQSVNVCHMPGKRKRVRMRMGYTSDWKKAVVRLRDGSKIEVA